MAAREDCGTVPINPAFVVAVANRAAGGQGAIEVDSSGRRTLGEAAADALGGFEHDQGIDGAARTGADRDGQDSLGAGMFTQAAECAGLGAEHGGPQCFVLAAIEFGFGLVGYFNDLGPVAEPFLQGAAGQLMSEVVPGASRQSVAGSHSSTGTEGLLCRAHIAVMQFCEHKGV
ncbi:MAG: hypothetical protein ABI051_09115 [Vicinamibacterales bacterium]